MSSEKITSSEASDKEHITYEQNVAGALSPVLTAEVQSPYQWVLVSGLAVRVDARDSNGDKISDGNVAVAVSPPNKRDKKVIDDKDLRTYADLSFTEQREDSYASQVQYEVDSGEFVVNTDFTTGIYLDTDTQIDTGESYFELEFQQEMSGE